MTTDYRYKGYLITPLYLGRDWACCFYRDGGVGEWMTGAMDTLEMALQVAHIMIDDLYLPIKLRLLTH